MESALLKSLKLLRNTSELLTEEEIAARIDEERGYVARALEELAQRKVVAKTGEFYCYQKTSKNEKLSQRILAVYDKIGARQKRESLILALIHTAVHKYLLRESTLLKVLEEEGFDLREVNNLLGEELEAGRIEKVQVTFVGKKGGGLLVPPAIPWYFVPSRLGPIKPSEYERLEQEWISEGSFIQKEDYLAANLSPGMANVVRQYPYKEMARVRKMIKGESFKWWYGWYGLSANWRWLIISREK
jgi:hypothetical protein